MEDAIDEMISIEDARALILSKVEPVGTEKVGLLDVVGRVTATDLASDIDVAPFPHSAMDGFAVRASQLAGATEDAPVHLKVIDEVAAGDVFQGTFADDECIRIMTGAELPEAADSVVKYEIVGVVSGDGKPGSVVSFTAPTTQGSNVRAAGEEAKAGETIVHSGDVISRAGVGYLASCGVLEVETYVRPSVAIIPTGSELVPPSAVPGPGHIRESNAYAIAACVNAAGAKAHMLPIVKDTFDDLKAAVEDAASRHDLVITTGGAANGDFDFIKSVVADLGEVYMTQVNMRPGKAQTFGRIRDAHIFGLPGNPAAAYCGFEMLIRPALRKMQGYTTFEHATVQAKLATDFKKKDPRCILLRSTLHKAQDGYTVTPAKNQSSGLFGVIQRSNCMVVMPEGTYTKQAGSLVDCILLDVPEDVAL